MRGTEQVRWGRVALEVDPSEVEGYFLYFLGASAACGRWEVQALASACGSRPALLFDVGANAGLIALGVAAECPAVEVIAFEPDGGAASKFTRNLALNPTLAPQVHLERLAVSDEDGTKLFFVGGEGNTEIGSLVNRHGNDTNHGRPISCARLDTFCSATGRRPDVLKIDVEGAELQVLKGMSGLPDGAWPRTILMEVHAAIQNAQRETFCASLHETLTNRGYRLWALNGEGPTACPAPAAWPDRFHLLAEWRSRAAA